MFGGATLQALPDRPRDGQVRALRKRQVVGGLAAGLRDGTYWSIWSHVADYDLPDAVQAAEAATRRLAETPRGSGSSRRLTRRS